VTQKETKDRGQDRVAKKGELQEIVRKRDGVKTLKVRQRKMIHYLCRLQQQDPSGAPPQAEHARL